MPEKDRFLEANFQLSKQQVVAKQPQNRIWRMRRQLSPPPPPVKLPPPDFVMSSKLEAVLKAMADDKVAFDGGDDGTADPDIANGLRPLAISSESQILHSPTANKHKADGDLADSIANQSSDTELFITSGSSASDINADVFRMEFPVAAVEQDSPLDPLTSVVTMADQQSPTFRLALSSDCQQLTPDEKSMTPRSSTPRSTSPSSKAAVKFSISSILSCESKRPTDDSNNEPRNVSPTNADEPEWQQANIQETIELCIYNLSRFFWALETCSERTRCRLAEACLFKRPVLEKILAIVRKLTIVVAPNQIERVLQLESAVERYFLEPPVTASAVSVSLCVPSDEMVAHGDVYMTGKTIVDDRAVLAVVDPYAEQEQLLKDIEERSKVEEKQRLQVNDDKCNNVIEETKCYVDEVIDETDWTKSPAEVKSEAVKMNGHEAAISGNVFKTEDEVAGIKMEPPLERPKSVLLRSVQTEVKDENGVKSSQLDAARLKADVRDVIEDLMDTTELKEAEDAENTAIDQYVVIIKDTKDMSNASLSKSMSVTDIALNPANAITDSDDVLKIINGNDPPVISDNVPKTNILTENVNEELVAPMERSQKVIDEVTMLDVSLMLSRVVSEVANVASREAAEVAPSRDQRDASTSNSNKEMADYEVPPKVDEVEDINTFQQLSPRSCSRNKGDVSADEVFAVILMLIEKVCNQELKVLPGFPGSFGYNMCKTLVPYIATNSYSIYKPDR